MLKNGSTRKELNQMFSGEIFFEGRLPSVLTTTVALRFLRRARLREYQTKFHVGVVFGIARPATNGVFGAFREHGSGNANRFSRACRPR